MGARLTGDSPAHLDGVASSNPLRVLFINDIAYVLDTLLPELPALGISPTFRGRQTRTPGSAQRAYPRDLFASFLDSHVNIPYDLLHVNYGLFGPVAWGVQTPVVLHLHGSDVRPGGGLRARVANIVSYWAARCATRVWYSTTDLAQYVHEMHVPHRYMPSPISDRFFGSSVEFPEFPSVLFAVPLAHAKGAEVAIDAMSLLRHRRPDIQVSAFGFGSDPEEAAQLRMKIPPGVHVRPWIQHLEMPSVFTSASVVVGQLHLGTLGLTELEAMASARPVITCEMTSLRQAEPYYQEDPPVVSVKDSATLADAVVEILTSGGRLHELGLQNREWARRFHSAKSVAKLYAAEYRRLV